MRLEEGFQHRLAGFLCLHLRGPTCQEIAKQDRIPMIEPLQRLRIVLLKRVTQAIGESRLVVCQGTALINHRGQCAYRNTLRLEWLNRSG